ncbi:winged helix-turn-helix domain-containing protein [Streptosporangiaceae bacterium NEAU-GS5]|nr:winged helix-turn-helix domain-containing protein [Streptosporangiaceae bacterium NEAU-GS5]
MRVSILGPLEVAGADGGFVQVPGARLRALLGKLALEAGRVVTLDELAEALWGDQTRADRVNALQSLVSRLRRALPEQDVLRSAPAGYRLEVPRDAVDAHRFARLAAEGRRALRDGDPRAATASLTEALRLWRGRPLADVADAPYADPVVTGLDEAWLAATEDRVEADLALGGRAVAELRDLVARHPLRERLVALLMKALYAEGRQAEALTRFEEFRVQLADELGVDPGPDLQQAYLDILRAEEPQAPPADDGRGRRARGNLRAPLTSFVGRETEIAQITAQLSDSRLVTLVGPGGAGKTRLAVTVAAGMAEPAWLVELAPVVDPADVPQAALGTLGAHAFRESASGDAVERMVEAFSGHDVLLLLDNCEHLVEAVARLADELLGRCPRLRVLATSREPLGIGGETLCPVPPLGLPDPGAPAESGHAVRLFLDRAAAVRPGFALTEANTADVIEICRRLDGLPLAIELAAARLRALTIEQVATRLDDRFRLLTGGSRTAMARHQTLRAVVAWSWDLLDDDERRLAERLAVFPAGCTLDTAERFGGTLDLLAALVDKSLVQVVDGPRYRMLETIREYGLTRLAESGELEAARAAHAAYFLELAETAEPHLRTRDQLEWIARLSAEHDNLLGALHNAARAEDAETAIRLAAALSLFWMISGRQVESLAWFQVAISVPGEAPEPGRTIVTLFNLVGQALEEGMDSMAAVTEKMKETIEATEGEVSHPLLIIAPVALALFSDDSAQGRIAIERRLAVTTDPWIRAMLQLFSAHLKENDGDLPGMRADLAIAIRGFRAVGERWGLANALTALAEGSTPYGDFGAVIADLEEAIGLIRQLNPDFSASQQRIWLATARARAGDEANARTEFLAIAESDSEQWTARDVSFARMGLADLARHNGDLDEAARQNAMARTSLAEATLIGPQFLSILLVAEGFVLVERGDLDATGDMVTDAAGHALAAMDMPVLAKVAIFAAARLAALGRHEHAAQTLGASQQLRGVADPFDPDVVRLTGALRAALGDEGFASAYAKGAALDRAAAIDQVRLL